VNIIFIMVSLFLSPAFLHAMDEQKHAYPVLDISQAGSLQTADQAESASREVNVAVAEPASSEPIIPAIIATDEICKWLSKENQQLLATHTIDDLRDACRVLRDNQHSAYTFFSAYATLQKSRSQERKDGGDNADLAPDQEGERLGHAYMKAVLRELGTRSAKRFTDLDEEITKRKSCCTKLSLLLGAAAQLSWWGLYAAATSKITSCMCFPWNATPWENRYLYPYCH